MEQCVMSILRNGFQYSVIPILKNRTGHSIISILRYGFEYSAMPILKNGIE